MNDDELRARLRAADPARRDAPAESWIDELVEATVTMNEQAGQDNRTEEARRRSRWLVPAVAAAAVAAIAVVGYSVVAGDDGGGTKDEQQTELALTMPANDPNAPIAMCMELTADALRPVETAFAGTATDVTGDQVTLDVDRWYKGGDADVVQLTSSTDAGVLLEGGVEFTEGEGYLVTATEGTVNGCGFSGAHTDDLAAIFDEAFGG
jgi:hypothetical protein